MPYKVFQIGEEALAADVNSYLMSQAVARFTNASQRTSQLTAPVLNQLSALDSVPGSVDYWTGSAWKPVLPTLSGNYVQITSNSGNVGATALIIPGLSLTVAAIGGRRWKLTVSMTVYQPTGGPSHIRPALREGATQLAGAIQRAETASFCQITFGTVVTPSAGNHTYDIYMLTDVGTAQVIASSQAPAWVLVEDIGP